jgi:AraC-like DNA-binding protein
VLISATRVINLCFYAENNVGAFSSVSVIMRIVLIFTVLLKMITTPEIIFGFPKLLERLAQTSKEAQLTNVEIWNLAHPYVTNVQDLKLTPIINTKLEAYAAEIEQFIHTHHSFRDSKYTLKHLARDTKIPSSHLTYIIKYHCKLSYVEFKNNFKILDAIRLIENNFLQSHTFDSLALKVGFVSYNSFYVQFKKQVGLSPKEYIERHHNVIHSYSQLSS